MLVPAYAYHNRTTVMYSEELSSTLKRQVRRVK